MPMTEAETKMLAELKAKFETSDKGKTQKMSGIEQDVYNALQAQFELDGQTGQKTVEKIVDDTVEKAIKDVREGRRTMQSVSRGVQQAVKPKGVLGKLKNTIDDVSREVSNRKPESIRDDINTNEIVALARTNGFPEKDAAVVATVTTTAPAAGSVDELIIAAAKTNAEGSAAYLDKGELQKLVTSAAFQNAAKALTGNASSVTVKAHNDKDDSLDTIIIEGNNGKKKTISLGDINLKLGSDVVDGPVVASTNVGQRSKREISV